MSFKGFSALVLISSVVVFVSCQPINLFEQNTIYPEHQWPSKQSNTYQFNVTDSTALYNVYFVIRHHNAYHYKNIWLQVSLQAAGDSVHTQMVNLNLAEDLKGWLGAGMGDLFDHRIALFGAPMRFKNGLQTISLQHIMREDPLQSILSTGIRVEKAKH